MHPKQALLKLQRVKNYLEFQCAERKFNRKYGRTGTRPLRQAIRLINNSIKEINKDYYFKSVNMLNCTVYIAESRVTKRCYIDAVEKGTNVWAYWTLDEHVNPQDEFEQTLKGIY